MKNISFDVLTNADDIAVICRNREELDKVIDLLEEWSNVNEIAVNIKKSGILVIDNDSNDTHQHRGYPLKFTMSCFLDMSKIIDSVERGNLRYTKSILGLSNQVNSDRLRIIFNRPLYRHSLGTHEEEHE